MTVPMLGLPLLKMAIRLEPDIVQVRQKTRFIAQHLGFDSLDQARLATATSELARNVFQYAGSGHLDFSFHEPDQCLYIRVQDKGPGIRHLDEIHNGTYVSKTGMGVGLSGTRKIMDHFQIETEPGAGTTVLIGKKCDRRAPLVTKERALEIVAKLANRVAENPFEEIQNQNRDLLTALDDLRQTKEELTQLNQELAETNRGVVALYAELDEKAESLQKANEIKTSFLSNMTHEFRTPLSSVISLTWLLLNRVDGELTPEQEKQVTYIRKSSEGLLDLVNNLLDIAKVEAGKVSVNPSEFEIEEVLGGLRGMFRPLLNNHENLDFIVLTDHPQISLITDQAKLSQILRNLVSNAIKFTVQGSVTVSTHFDDAQTVRFTVKDTGVGIPESHMDTIFEDFSQIDSPLQKPQKGTGLGLPLSRKLARLLGGEIEVESSIGKGSTFHLRIPRCYGGELEGILFTSGADKTKQATTAASIEVPTTEKFRILLIDDDEASRYILKSLLNKELDAQISEVTSGQVGLEMLRQWRPDLIFLDLSMPEMDGFAVLRAIRQDPQFADIAVIVNSAKKLTPEEQNFLDKYATAFVSKERPDDAAATADLKKALQQAGFDYR